MQSLGADEEVTIIKVLGGALIQRHTIVADSHARAATT
jgi:hypothetical protein